MFNCNSKFSIVLFKMNRIYFGFFKMNTKLTKLQSELNEEKELNKCLSSNQEVYQTKLNQMEESLKKLTQEKDSEIQELKSQLRDIMFYLDAQNKISESKDLTKEELQESHVIIQQDQAAGTSSGATGKSNRRRKNRKNQCLYFSYFVYSYYFFIF